MFSDHLFEAVSKVCMVAMDFQLCSFIFLRKLKYIQSKVTQSVCVTLEGGGINRAKQIRKIKPTHLLKS